MILDEDLNRRCEEIAKHYGSINQLIQLSEECGELITSALHYRRAEADGYIDEDTRHALKEEIVDVLIMINQMINIGIITEDEIYGIARVKIKRQERRIADGRNYR